MIFNTNMHVEKIKKMLKRTDFPEKLDFIMTKKGINSYQLANDMGVTHPTVKRYLNGYPPKKPYAIRMCISLNLTSDEAIELLDSAGIVFSHNCNRDIVFEYIIDNIDLVKASVTDTNNLIDDLTKEFKYKRKIDKIELI